MALIWMVQSQDVAQFVNGDRADVAEVVRAALPLVRVLGSVRRRVGVIPLLEGQADLVSYAVVRGETRAELPSKRGHAGRSGVPRHIVVRIRDEIRETRGIAGKRTIRGERGDGVDRGRRLKRREPHEQKDSNGFQLPTGHDLVTPSRLGYSGKHTRSANTSGTPVGEVDLAL